MPADVLELVTRCRLADDIAAVGQEEAGVETAEYRRRGDRAADIGQGVDRSEDALLGIGRLDWSERGMWRGGSGGGRGSSAAGAADQHADLLPSFAQRGAGAAQQARRQMRPAAFDP